MAEVTLRERVVPETREVEGVTLELSLEEALYVTAVLGTHSQYAITEDSTTGTDTVYTALANELVSGYGDRRNRVDQLTAKVYDYQGLSLR